VLARRNHCAAIASEELENIHITSTDRRAKYLVLFDPLDGSSNIDVNISIGTIFGVLRKSSDSETTTEEDFLKPGRDLIAAGYILYGSSTMFVITTGHGGVHAFTYDPTVGEFFLSHENIRIPNRASLYSINEGNTVHWNEDVRRWNAYLKEEDKSTARPYGARYVGTLVADAHRTLMKGGIFVYPADKKNTQGQVATALRSKPLRVHLRSGGRRRHDWTRSHPRHRTNGAAPTRAARARLTS
jgi:fructose-1,6-bisphosphatase I